MKIYMFHYVRPDKDPNLPYLNYFSLKKFTSFLDNELNSLKIISPKEYLELKNKRKDVPGDSVILTFDDGLSDHYNFVFPELKKRGLNGLFFINSLPFYNSKLLLVHKIHFLSGLIGYHRFMKLFSDELNKNSRFVVPEFEAKLATRAYPYDESTIANFKYLINYKLPKALVDMICETIILTNFKESKLLKSFYLSLDQISEMERDGNIFGYHGHTHTAFSLLNKTELFKELEYGKALFDKLGIKTAILSFPYGDISSINSETLEVVKTFGIEAAFMAEKVTIDFDFLISRTDCKEIS